MALEDLTGPAKFINSLVPGNPVSNDDRREGDDHIRGIKNVLRNTFPNINAAATITDEQLNSLPADLTALAGALKIAQNLADLANKFTALVNLGVQDVNGHWTIVPPLTAGGTLYVASNDQAGVGILEIINVAAGSVPQAYIAHSGGSVVFGNHRAGGLVTLVAGGFQGFTTDDQGQAVFTQKAGAGGSQLTLQPKGSGWGLWIEPDGSSTGNFQIMHFPGGGGKFMAAQVGGTLAAPLFGLRGFGAGSKLELGAEGGGILLSIAPPSISGAQPLDAANDASIATTAFVHAHTVTGKGANFTQQTSPAFATAYQNTTNKPRWVGAVVNMTAAGEFDLQLSPDNVTFTTLSVASGAVGRQSINALVPPGYWYRVRLVSGTGTLVQILFST